MCLRISRVRGGVVVVDDVTDLPFQRMQTDPPAGVSASPIADNVMTWYKNPRFNSFDDYH